MQPCSEHFRVPPNGSTLVEQVSGHKDEEEEEEERKESLPGTKIFTLPVYANRDNKFVAYYFMELLLSYFFPASFFSVSLLFRGTAFRRLLRGDDIS